MPENKDISMPAQHSDPLLLSKEVREIISYKPVWIVRHGILLFFIIFCVLVSLAFFIGYPDIVSGKAKILSSENTEYSAEVYIPKNDLGKLNHGQTVILKLYSFPFQQFGVVTGAIDSIYSMPAEDSGYIARVILPQGLKTNFNKQIQYIPGLTGTAEILTADTKLSDRLFIQLKHIFK